uniref:Uncharacterized protein n=1 Tax=Octopus bimaculoides TaxID=37653 RepID=A0A0L8FLP3_OCTBM
MEESNQLPPCKDCLFMHALQANYQAAIWRRCLQAQLYVPSPIDCGWTLDKESDLIIAWMHWMLFFSFCPASLCIGMCQLRTCDNQAPEFSNREQELELMDSQDDHSD